MHIRFFINIIKTATQTYVSMRILRFRQKCTGIFCHNVDEISINIFSVIYTVFNKHIYVEKFEKATLPRTSWGNHDHKSICTVYQQTKHVNRHVRVMAHACSTWKGINIVTEQIHQRLLLRRLPRRSSHVLYEMKSSAAQALILMMVLSKIFAFPND